MERIAQRLRAAFGLRRGRPAICRPPRAPDWALARQWRQLASATTSSGYGDRKQGRPAATRSRRGAAAQARRRHHAPHAGPGSFPLARPATALAPLPVARPVGWNLRTVEQLSRWGLRRIEDLAGQPRAAARRARFRPGPACSGCNQGSWRDPPRPVSPAAPAPRLPPIRPVRWPDTDRAESDSLGRRSDAAAATALAPKLAPGRERRAARFDSRPSHRIKYPAGGRGRPGPPHQNAEAGPDPPAAGHEDRRDRRGLR